MRALSCLLILAVAFLPALLLADAAKPLGKSGDWQSYTYSEKGGRVCYMASQPKKSDGAPKGRNGVFFTITHRTSDKSVGVISISQGITYKKGAPVELEVGATRFDLYGSGDSAWSRNDKAVVAALLKNKTAALHGTPASGAPVTDRYSLDGFAKAYADISKACGIA